MPRSAFLHPLGSSVIAIAIAVGVIIVACEGDSSAIPNLSVDQVAALLEADSPFVLLDANVEGVRRDSGVIPGARLLSSFRDYAWSELPTDKSSQLVFYCASSMCSAAPSAARRAQEHGYENVAVMAAGIRGWIAADGQVDFPHLRPLS